MPSLYLQSGDYAAYGLDSSTTSAQVQTASAVVDSYLKRTEGLVWTADGQGLPCYMAALNPSFSTTLPVALTAGVAATIAFPLASHGASSLIGDVLVVDRETPNLTEALPITAVDPIAGTITLAASVFNHSSEAPLEQGLVIMEERAIAPKRSQTRVSTWPVARLLSGCGRYSYGRRSEQVAGLSSDVNLLAVLQTFGGPPMWVPFDIRQADMSAATGEIWVPAGMLLAYYTEVRLRYIAGYPAGGLPAAIKQATANIVRTMAAGSDYAPPNFKVAQAGGSKFERFSDSQLDTDTRDLLEPYSQKLFF